MSTLKKQLLVFSIVIIGIYGCGTSKNVTVDKMNFPPDFMKHKSHILIPLYDNSGLKSWGIGKDVDPMAKRNEKRLNEWAQADFPQYYKGDYDFLQSGKDILETPDATDKYKVINNAYADIDKYRYVFCSYFDHWVSAHDNGMQHIEQHWGIYDRKENRVYMVKVDHLNHAVFVQKLEEGRAQ